MSIVKQQEYKTQHERCSVIQEVGDEMDFNFWNCKRPRLMMSCLVGEGGLRRPQLSEL